MARRYVDVGVAARQYGRPLTEAELRTEADAQGRVSVLVGVSVPDMLSLAEDGEWVDTVSEWVTGRPGALVDQSWRAIGVDLTGGDPDDQHVLVEMSGRVLWGMLQRAPLG